MSIRLVALGTTSKSCGASDTKGRLKCRLPTLSLVEAEYWRRRRGSTFLQELKVTVLADAGDPCAATAALTTSPDGQSEALDYRCIHLLRLLPFEPQRYHPQDRTRSRARQSPWLPQCARQSCDRLLRLRASPPSSPRRRRASSVAICMQPASGWIPPCWRAFL